MKRTLMLFLVSFCIVFSVTATDSNPWALRVSTIFIAEDNGLEGNPSPLLPSAGFVWRIPLSGALSFEPALDFWTTWYTWSDTLSRPVPSGAEYRSARDYTFMLSAPVTWTFSLPANMSVSVFAGPAFHLRLFLPAEGLEGADLIDAQSDTDRIARWSWDSFRFLQPLVGVTFSLPRLSSVSLSLEARTWIPLFQLWDTSNLPPAEGWKLSIGIRVAYSISNNDEVDVNESSTDK